MSAGEQAYLVTAIGSVSGDGPDIPFSLALVVAVVDIMCCY
jgi:hypothetical protein